MSTGISISSINRIKELAEQNNFAEALEILDTQDLDKSINPQFLRISGEIFRENKRYYDCRKILLKAHQMSPQGLRIIAELIQLYLELGYFSKAKKYYEQYLFYATSDDVQKDYVEYIMKKGTGSDIKELAAILIPILERMPEDRWNFEAVLLYDKLGRKDKALDESRYILEQFKESRYVDPVIKYIDEQLDVDLYFYTFPKEEVEEDVELFGDLIELEEKILEEDYLRMYPPEARIRVEAEDKEIIDIKPVREKKQRKKHRKNSEELTEEEGSLEKKSDKSVDSKVEHKNDGETISDHSTEENNGLEVSEEDIEQQIQKEREAELEKILSKKSNIPDIRETAKQVAKSVKAVDTKKAKQRVKVVTDAVKGNVKKATEVLSEAVGTTDLKRETETVAFEEEIVDGIIEGVVEPPKKTVGQVVMNGELDSLIPDSLEALSENEVEEIENRIAEEERIELEALETQLQLEEEKKKQKKKKNAVKKQKVQEEDAESVTLESVTERVDCYQQLKEQFLSEQEEESEEQPLDSLGFISVVQSDVDTQMEEDIPFAAGILHQMINNKEFYTGEDSTRFETKASYENHGFEIEDYEFNMFDTQEMDITHEQLYDNVYDEGENIPKIEIIYAKEEVIDFFEIVPDSYDEKDTDDSAYNLVGQANAEQVSVETENDTTDSLEEEKIVVPVEVNDDDVHTEEVLSEQVIFEDENAWENQFVEPENIWNTESSESADVQKDEVEELEIQSNEEKIMVVNQRSDLRIRIMITSDMSRALMSLKECR